MNRRSGERLVSSPALELIHEALALHAGTAHSGPVRLSAPEISAAALRTPFDPVARRALEVFCAMLGTLSGNLALTLGSVGGLYGGGGIVPQIIDFFQQSEFRSRFERKGRFSEWLSRIPTWVVMAPRSALRGASAMLDDHLTADHGAGPLLDEIRAALPRLSDAERDVANDLLAAPGAWMSDPIARIAERSGVSTPTVMRFCRSMGFVGLADFKLRLGSGLSGTTKIASSPVQAGDPTAERMAKVCNNSISALIGLRDRLHPAFERALALLGRARCIEVYGTGSASIAAQDAQHKLGRLGLLAVARCDLQLQNVTSAFLGGADVLLVISNSGTLDASSEAAARARARARARPAGAPVIAICPQHSDLARLADVVMPVDHPQDLQALVPMVSQLMQTVIVDMLVTELAMARRETITQALAHQREGRFVALSLHGA